jgi:membrane protein
MATVGVKERVDAYQRKHGWAGFFFAVVQKFGEDQAGNLAALIAYYAFFSIFPLLLALTTILGYVLAGAPELREEVFQSAVGQLPIIGQQSSLEPLTGNPFALIIGLALAVWSGLAVAQTAQTAFNTVYAVPRTQWPGFLPRLRRSAELVAVGGLGLIATTLLQGVVSGTQTYGLHIGLLGEILAAVVGILFNWMLFSYLFRRLTVHPLKLTDVTPGAALAAVSWFVLQKLGTSLVNNKIQGAEGAYGTFAVVIGLLFWFFILAQITLLCAEVNIVRSERLWPRGLSSLTGQASTRADMRAYSFYTRREAHATNLEVTTHLTPEQRSDSPDTTAAKPTSKPTSEPTTQPLNIQQKE